MKKNLLLTLVALFCVVYAQAGKVKIGDLYYYLYSTDNTATVTSPTSSSEEYSGDIVIPSSITCDETTYSVTSIGESAFSGCTGLTSITIGNSVTSIGKYAFSGCPNLTSITIPNSVTSIGERAFYNCTDLTSITIPNSVTSIGNYAFDRVLNINYNGTATGAPWGAQNMNRYVEDYLVYESAAKTKVLDCSELMTGHIIIPNSVVIIEGSAFSNCTGLTSITIPNSVTSIGGGAFSDCTGLTSITIPKSVTSIGWSAFYDCTGLTSVTIPNSVTSIGGYAFWGCTGLTSVTIPNSVTSIGEYAFANVPNIVYYGTATGAPWGAKSMNGYIDGYLVYEDETKTKLLACSSAATGEIVIPKSVTSIGESAFRDCTGLTSITIPNSVTSIGESAFSGCWGLTSITIPNSVTSIGEGAFSGCTGLTSITIPNSVTSIGGKAFYDCTGLTSITIPNSVTSIGDYAFAWCTGLTSITIPNSVTSIGGKAFYDCTGLTSITIPNSVTSIGDYAFAWCTGLTSATIGNSVTSIGKYAFSDCNHLTSVIWNAINCNGGWSNYKTAPFFDIASQITSFTFGTQVKRIPYAICDNMNNLTSISIPDSVTSISASAFWGCSGLTSVTIPNRVTSIGNSAFSGCTGLTSITSLAAIPPTTWKDAFGNILTDIPVYVPCGSRDAYSMAEEWKSFTNYIEQLTAIVAITSQDENKGIVTITKQASCEDNECTFVATAKEDYRFVQWSDGNTDNPRTIIVTEDITLTAEFEDTSATNVLQTADNQFTTPQKIVRDGQVYILRNGKTYTTTGVEVK